MSLTRHEIPWIVTDGESSSPFRGEQRHEFYYHVVVTYDVNGLIIEPVSVKLLKIVQYAKDCLKTGDEWEPHERFCAAQAAWLLTEVKHDQEFDEAAFKAAEAVRLGRAS
jgi:hypothetical protein